MLREIDGDLRIGEIAAPDQSEAPSFVGVKPHAVDPGQAERLWALSAELTGIDAFAMQ
ncbi:hypothetical protein [Billgrantia endophytica]|uniref:hypothetical protein n=1 Tax=Billgrantia endophytica TaxID=2033802 RepID=UPI00197AE2DC|nr:hypothetical protein [Halomonas endophytica]